MRIITTVILLMCTVLLYGQFAIDTSYAEKRSFIKTTLKLHKKYTVRSNVAYMDEDYEQAKFLYDSLVQHALTGTYFDNVRLNTIGKGKLFTEDIDIPIVLTTNTSWCVPNKGEIPALNDLAHSYKKKVKIIALFWGRKPKVETLSESYDENIIVAYVDERDNKNARLVESVKHTLGYPVTLFIDKDKRVVSINRNGEEVKSTYVGEEKAYQMNHEWYTKYIDAMFIEEGSITNSEVAVKTNEK